MKVTAIERVSAIRSSSAYERQTADAQRIPHLTSNSAASSDAEPVAAAARTLPVLAAGNDTALRDQHDATLAYAQRNARTVNSPGAEGASAGLLAPLPPGADAAQALNQVYRGADVGSTAPGAEVSLPGDASAAPSRAAVEAPPKEPMSKQLMELVNNLWAASRAAVDAVNPPEPTPAPPPPTQDASLLAAQAGLLPASGDRRSAARSAEVAAEANAGNSTLRKTYNTRNRTPAVRQQA